jgi:hypothetical protein
VQVTFIRQTDSCIRCRTDPLFFRVVETLNQVPEHNLHIAYKSYYIKKDAMSIPTREFTCFKSFWLWGMKMCRNGVAFGDVMFVPSFVKMCQLSIRGEDILKCNIRYKVTG